MIIDLRSDTVTKPSQAMREYMMKAEVGDDVFGEDTSILDLENRIQKMFGTEAAMFTPTATMSNQIALKILTQPLDEIICDRYSHIYNYEVGGYAFNSGCSIRYLTGERGVFTSDDIIKNINPVDVHKTITKLVSLENTVNRGGGKIFPIVEMQKIKKTCDKYQLKLHLDGSRIFNAIVEEKQDPAVYGNIFDTITLCFSKGLGCPVGSVLTGKKEFLDKARRVRKVFGGGMRQGGIIAAACIYALENNIERLRSDHQMAKFIEQQLLQTNFISDILSVETNIIIFKLHDNINDISFIDHLAKQNILAFAIGDNWIRFVTHLDIKEEMTDKIASTLEKMN
ncbi:MAG: threonine aldolase family protein [Chitinophagales bacterium]